MSLMACCSIKPTLCSMYWSVSVYLTIVSDASCSHHSSKKNRTGFAFRIRGDDIDIKKAWYEDVQMSSDRAESIAALGALKSIPEKDWSNTKLIYYIDCESVIKSMRGEFTSVKGRRNWDTRTKLYRHYLKQFKEVEIRHVKAHTGGTRTRDYIQQWCDMNARAMMRHGRYHINRKPNQG